MLAMTREEAKQVLLEVVARGELMPGEAARHLPISRATAFRWAKEAGIDWQAARDERLRLLMIEEGINPRRAAIITNRVAKTSVARRRRARRIMDEIGE